MSLCEPGGNWGSMGAVGPCPQPTLVPAASFSWFTCTERRTHSPMSCSMQRKDLAPGVDLIADNIKCFFSSSLFLQPLLSRVPLCKSYGCPNLSRLQPSPIPAGGTLLLQPQHLAGAFVSGERWALVLSGFAFWGVQMLPPSLLTLSGHTEHPHSRGPGYASSSCLVPDAAGGFPYSHSVLLPPSSRSLCLWAGLAVKPPGSEPGPRGHWGTGM